MDDGLNVTTADTTPAPAASPAATPATGPTVLIAEDEEALRSILVQTFQSYGYTTFEAADGEAALAIAMKEKPTVTILDIMMPKMDGLETLKKIRLDPAWGAKALVIMLTNLTADNKILQDLSQSSPSYYFVKSDMEPDQLIAKVKEILE